MPARAISGSPSPSHGRARVAKTVLQMQSSSLERPGTQQCVSYPIKKDSGAQYPRAEGTPRLEQRGGRVWSCPEEDPGTWLVLMVPWAARSPGQWRLSTQPSPRAPGALRPCSPAQVTFNVSDIKLATSNWPLCSRAQQATPTRMDNQNAYAAPMKLSLTPLAYYVNHLYYL